MRRHAAVRLTCRLRYDLLIYTSQKKNLKLKKIRNYDTLDCDDDTYNLEGCVAVFIDLFRILYQVHPISSDEVYIVP